MTGGPDGHDEPSSPAHDRRHDDPQPFAGDAAIIHLRGREVQPPFYAVWFFYVQHQFEETTWEATADWSQPEAALHGSSFYDLPPPLPWLSGNIGVHHVHHLSSGIPFYRLPEVLRDHPELKEVGRRLSLRDSLACVRLALWDEEKRRMVSFEEAGASRRAGARAEAKCD